MATADFYADPLVYDILHGPGTADDIAALLRMVRRHRPTGLASGRPGGGSLIFLEPACGSARYLLMLVSRGYRCVGFDLLEGMITYAQRCARTSGVEARGERDRLELFVADMTDFTRGREESWWATQRVDIAFNFINTIRHIESDEGLIAHLRSVRSILHPKGFYYVGISLCDYGNEDPTEDVWEGSRDGVHVHQVVNYIPCPAGSGPDARDERVVSHMTVTDAQGNERHIDSAYVLRGYSRGEFEAAVKAAGMVVRCWMESDGRREMEPEGAGYTVAVLCPAT